MDSNPLTLHLGARDYLLEPQRTGRIFKKLSVIAQAFSGETPTSVTGVVYDALRVFIPKLAPEWELAGYPSAEAYEAKLAHDRELSEGRQAYAEEMGFPSWDAVPLSARKGFDGPEFEDPSDDDETTSPTIPEIADAIETIYAVNGGPRLERLLKGLVDKDFLKAVIRNEYLKRQTSIPSPTSPPTNGASAPTPSGTTAPTTQPDQIGNTDRVAA